MSTIIRASDGHTYRCCDPWPPVPGPCWDCPANQWREDNWPNCDWKVGCPTCDVCGFPVHPRYVCYPQQAAITEMDQCYNDHFAAVERQSVKFWEGWLAPIPAWLNGIALMQEVNVHKPTASIPELEDFDCAAF